MKKVIYLTLAVTTERRGKNAISDEAAEQIVAELGQLIEGMFRTPPETPGTDAYITEVNLCTVQHTNPSNSEAVQSAARQVLDCKMMLDQAMQSLGLRLEQVPWAEKHDLPLRKAAAEA